MQPPTHPHPRQTSAFPEPKSHLISSGTAESPCGRQSPAPQVTPVPRGPGRGRTTLEHWPGPLTLSLLATVPLPSGKLAPAYSSPAKLGDFSLRLPKHPKLPDLRHCASFPPAFKARTAWETWALDVLSDSCESSISHFLETLGDFSLHRLGFQSVPPALSPGTLLGPMGGLRTNLSHH